MNGRCDVRSAADDPSFVGRQQAYFQHADPAKFRWQTSGAVFAETEAWLVAPARGTGRLLEVGCGEGGNLFHLGPRSELTIGVDLSEAKTRFAARAISWAKFACGNALRLPFPAAAFDRVFCRDVLHHLPLSQRREAVAELCRVCRRDGELVVIEPNGLNPLIGAFALLVPAERGLLRSTPGRVVADVRSAALPLTVEMRQPFPMARALLHYRFGAPGLGRSAAAGRCLRFLDRATRWLVPRVLWAYIVVRGRPAR